MKKGETLSEWQSRVEAREALPGKLESLTGRVRAMIAAARETLEAKRANPHHNRGGENSGTMENL